MLSHLKETLKNNRSLHQGGIYSICSSHPMVIEAAMLHSKSCHDNLVIESTSNQVNQEGGYTGMKPANFQKFIAQTAARLDINPSQIILGGDHLGPHAWQHLNAAEAMAKARQLIIDYVAAGYQKIHLDASMACKDDMEDFGIEQIAGRTADLCLAAEDSWQRYQPHSEQPIYVIGSEVPIPGGAHEAMGELVVSSSHDTLETIELTHRAFKKRGLEDAWQRVVAVVVQPGVEFNDNDVMDYEPQKARELSNFILSQERMVYEAHSTDYQTPEALKQLVADHFAILKVGPWLTFALRQALLGLQQIEVALLGRSRNVTLSHLKEVVTTTMQYQPQHWQNHYHGDAADMDFACLYSYSDRIRYYWDQPACQAAVKTLIQNLDSIDIPLPVINQFLPNCYPKIREGQLNLNPLAMIYHEIREVISVYSAATYNEPSSLH